MTSKIPCEMIADLLPLYVEQLVSDKTKDEIQKHLTECAYCRKQYEEMRAGFQNESAAPEKKEPDTRLMGNGEIDYLKKIRKNTRKKIILGIVFTLIAVAVLCGLKLFVWGFPVQDYEKNIEVSEGKVIIDGSFENSSYAFSRYKIAEGEEEDTLIVYGCLPSKLKTSESFHVEYELSDQMLQVGEDTILPDGFHITEKAVRLYEEKNPYIGDAPGNNRLAQTLGISALGGYENELQTQKEPYGWTLHFQEELEKNREESFNNRMTSYAHMLLALVDNCQEIRWTYRVEGKTLEKEISAEDASQALGQNIKTFGKNEKTVQELLNIEGLT